MKRSTATLLVLALCIGLISATCANTEYTNPDSSCSAACVPPLITQEKDKTCLEAKNCAGYFHKHALQCVDVCPENFEENDTTTPKICIPCFFQDAKNNCFAVCPQPLISNTITKKCIENPSECAGYFFKEQAMCFETCPFGTIPQTVNNQKICVPCDVLNQCASIDINTCKEKLSSDKKRCGRDCPPLETIGPVVDGQNYTQCAKCAVDKKVLSSDGKTCLAACDANQLVDKKSMRCIEPAQCDQFVGTIGDDGFKYCLPQCPPNQSPSAVSGQAYQECKACAVGEVFDPITKACGAKCTITGMNEQQQPICLRTIFECRGLINLAQTACVQTCEVGQVVRPSELPGQFFCIASCADDEFKIPNPKINIETCVKTCPPDHFADSTKKTCTLISQCTANVSLDGQQCLEKCPPGQIPDLTTKKCKPCDGKIQADGKTCGTACAAAELFDVDLRICVTADKCANKITNTTDKVCSTNCRPGDTLQEVNGVKSCIKPTACAKIIASDGRSCVDACQSNEITATDPKNNVKICIVCPLGIAADGISCTTSCPNFFDAQQKKCVDTCAKYKSVNNKICSDKCIPPEVNKTGDTTQCHAQCDASQVFSKTQGCIDLANCTDYISSNNVACVPKCADIMEADPTDGTKKCVRCSDVQVPILQGTGATRKVQCADKSASNTDAKLRAQSLNDALKELNQIGPDQKPKLKDQLKTLGTEIATGIKETNSSATLTSDEKKQQIKSLIDNLRSVAKQFNQKIPNSDSLVNGDATEDRLELLSTEYNLVSEKLRYGHAFKTQFNAADFQSTVTAPDLQVNISANQDVDAAQKYISNIDSLQVTNLPTNPYCKNDAACGTSGLFTVEASTSVRRILQQASEQTYQTTYSVSADKIAKTICVSYDTNGIMSLATTTADKTNNKITCTFTTNASLYYDSTCQYIAASNCSTNNNNTNNNNQFDQSITSGSKIFVSLVAATLILLA